MWSLIHAVTKVWNVEIFVAIQNLSIGYLVDWGDVDYDNDFSKLLVE